MSKTNILIGGSHIFEDIASNDLVCATIDVVGNIYNSVNFILNNITLIKHLIFIKGYVTIIYIYE